VESWTYKNDLGLDLIVKQTANNHVTNAGAYWGSWRKNLSADVFQVDICTVIN